MGGESGVKFRDDVVEMECGGVRIELHERKSG